MQLIQTTATNQAKISAISALSALARWFQAMQKSVSEVIFVASELEVKKIMHGDQIFWYAFNPMTGQEVYADSEMELRQWIEANYQEH